MLRDAMRVVEWSFLRRMLLDQGQFRDWAYTSVLRVSQQLEEHPQ